MVILYVRGSLYVKSELGLLFVSILALSENAWMRKII